LIAGGEDISGIAIVDAETGVYLDAFQKSDKKLIEELP
jgi:hypothetical protein